MNCIFLRLVRPGTGHISKGEKNNLIEKTLIFDWYRLVPWPSWLRHRANNAGISGSIPLGTIFMN